MTKWKTENGEHGILHKAEIDGIKATIFKVEDQSFYKLNDLVGGLIDASELHQKTLKAQKRFVVDLVNGRNK